MKMFLSRSLGMAAVAALLATASSAQPSKVIAPLEQESAAAKAQRNDRAYLALSQDPATAAIRLVKADPGQVTAKATTISLALGAGLDLQVRRVDSYVNESGSLVWSGVILKPGAAGLEFDPLDTVMLVKNGKKITGNIRYEGQLYQIRPLKKSGHVLVTVDTDRFPPEHPPSYSGLPRINMKSSSSGAPNLVTANSGNTTISVLVNYTPSAASASGDINGLIDLAVAESNQGYANSGVAITLQLVKKARTTYTESASFDTDLARYRGTADGYMNYIHTQRNQYGADIGVLILNNAQYCGLASGIGSSVSTAFAGVHWSCATGNYSFAHEIGHLLSARHNPEADPTNTPYAYGHGFRYTGSPSWRTIMSYDCPAGCPRLNYWSNPNRLYNGVAMGTFATHDNTRVLNTTCTTVAGFKTAPNCVPDGGSDDTLGQTSCCSGVAVNNSTYCSNPADWGTTWASCNHICGTQLVNGCVPSGGVDDTLSSTSCCSGAAVPGSTWCLDPADYGDDWKTCAQICQ